MVPARVLVFAVCVAAGCKTAPQRAVPASSGRPVPAAAASGAASAATVAPRGFDEASVRSFIERWVAAQNTHDFTAYSALYAPRFTGTKRVGSYAKRFERSAWLTDRRSMFVDGVVVRATELELSGSPGAVRAVFTQDFVAPGFHDTGKKELFLVEQGSGWAISREEMLASRVSEAAPLADSAVLAFHRDGVVLQNGRSGAAPSTAPRLLARGPSDSFDVAVPLADASVSEATRAWLGRSITVYARDGASCQGVIKGFEVRVKSEPHFGMRQAWDGQEGAPKATADEIAAQIWKIARDDERFVVGVLDRECHGNWAVTRASSFFVAQPPPPSTRAVAVAAFKQLPAYRELQARFARETSGSATPWESVDGELRVVELRASADPALLVVAARGGVSCGGFTGNLSAIWAVSGTAPALKLEPRGVFKDSVDMLRVYGAVDQNADGSLELLAGPDGFASEISLLRSAAGGYSRRPLLASAVWDCSC